MKKMFLAAITALALCSYSYAQDDEEYEEDEAPAKVEKAPAVEEEEEEEEEAVEEEAPAKAEKKSSKKSKGKSGPFLGMGIGIDQNDIMDFEGSFFIGNFEYLKLMFKITDNMMITGKFGLAHHGETTTTTTAGGNEVETPGSDDYTPLVIGAQFDYFLPTPLLPTSIGGEFMYASAGEIDDGLGNSQSGSAILFGILFGAHANLADNLVLTGTFGLGFEYVMSEQSSAGGNKVETGRMDIGTKAGISLGWFFM